MLKLKWNILAVVDDSTAGERVVDCALDLCSAGLECKLYLIYVKDVEPNPITSGNGDIKFYSNLRNRANEFFSNVREKLKTAKVEFEIIGSYFGIVAEEIERIERRLRIDLIVICTKKQSLLRRIFDGDYSERVISETKAPVLVVKPEYEPKIRGIIKTAGRVRW